MRERDKGPRSELSRYAFGYSDKKPGMTYWLVQAVVCAIAIWGVLR
jgi:hypothetical protein